VGDSESKSYADALNTFGRWERQNENPAVLGSNSGCVISLRSAQLTLCLADILQLTFSEDGILRFLLRGATLTLADPKDFPAESSVWFTEFERRPDPIREHRDATFYFSFARESFRLKQAERERIA